MIGLILLMVGAVLVPWSLELLNVIEPSVTFADGFMRILPSSVDHQAELAVQLGLTIFAPMLVGIAVVTAMPIARSEETARRRLHTQSWWLSQLIAPRGTSGRMAAVR
jgi:hypothetical protein